jgi:prolyl-tRNA synthetase
MIAPVQVVIIPIKADETVNAFIKDLAKDLRDLSIRVKVDDRETKTPGWKFNEWEVKGVPLRIEIGPKELEGAELSIYRRDKNARLKVQKAKLVEEIKTLLNDIQKTLLEKHKKFTEDNTHTVDSYDEFKKIMSTTRGFIRALWCEDKACEAKIKEETKATTRCLPLDSIDSSKAMLFNCC